MSKTISPRIQSAVINAVNWLRANPQRHITGALAMDDEGQNCQPNDPTASCFCVLGRISHELNVAGYPDEDYEFDSFLFKVNTRRSVIFNQNDLGLLVDPNTGYAKVKSKLCHNELRGNPKVLETVEKLVPYVTPLQRLRGVIARIVGRMRA